MKTPFQIFKAGLHTAMSGVTLAFTEADLDAMARAYDPARHEAPIVVGHPSHDAPAYGWVASLARSGDVLQASPAQVDPAFAEMVGAGRFKKVSASFYAPGAPNNPVPETYYLRHVGFLGAQPPAVKGLRDAQFGEEDGVFTLEFGEPDAVPDAPPTDPAEPQAEPVAPPEEVDMSGQDDLAARESALAAQKQALDAREAEFAAREQALKALEDQARRQSINDFAEQMEAQGRLLPRHRAGLIEFMAAQADDTVLEFGEGEGTFKGASLEWLKGFLSDLPVQVDYAERVRGGADESTARFTAPEHHQVDPERLALHTKALAYQEAHPGTSYTDAVLTISNGA